MNFTGNDTIARFPTFMRAYLNIPHKSSNRTNFQSRLIIISRKKTEQTRRNFITYLLQEIPHDASHKKEERANNAFYDVGPFHPFTNPRAPR